MAEWQFENGIPIYLQIISKINMDIVKGALKPGDKLPAVRALAAEAGVTPNTVQRALTALEEKELVYTRRTSGRFVTENEERITALKNDMTNQIISDFFHSLQEIGMNREEILSAVTQWKDSDSKEGGRWNHGSD